MTPEGLTWLNQVVLNVCRFGKSTGSVLNCKLRFLSADFSADFSRPQNNDSPSISGFDQLHVDPQRPPWQASSGHIFPLGEPIIPSHMGGQADAPAYASRPMKAENDEDRMSLVRSGKRRKDPDDQDDTKEKAKPARKIYVACDFCRGEFTLHQVQKYYIVENHAGRKLRCDGNKPTCWNCVSRKKLCVYQPYPRRRGPGKAPKGTRSKKRTEGHSPSRDTSNPQIVVPQQEMAGEYGEETPLPFLPMMESPVEASSSQAGPSGAVESEGDTSQTRKPEPYDGDDDESEF